MHYLSFPDPSFAALRRIYRDRQVRINSRRMPRHDICSLDSRLHGNDSINRSIPEQLSLPQSLSSHVGDRESSGIMILASASRLRRPDKFTCLRQRQRRPGPE